MDQHFPSAWDLGALCSAAVNIHVCVSEPLASRAVLTKCYRSRSSSLVHKNVYSFMLSPLAITKLLPRRNWACLRFGRF